MFISWALTLVVASATAASAASLGNNTSTFFGGNAAGEIQDYIDWTNTVSYKGVKYLPSEGDATDGAAIHWNIDEDQGILELAVVVRATGWLGFGISENGGMLGSDMLIFESLDPTTLKDAYVTDYRTPEFDDCQNWELVSSSTDTEFLIVEMTRKLNTEDSQDWPIHNDASVETSLQRVIAAWGDSDRLSYHGAKNARSTIRWYGFGKDESDDFQATMNEKAVGSFRFDLKDYSIPANETTYRSFCITADDMRAQNVPLDDGVTLIGFEPIITSPFVHHYTLYASHSENNNATCDNSADYMDLLYIWAPGEPPLMMPNGVGVSVGGNTENFWSFRLEYHFDNKQKQSGLYDSSGIQFFYSQEAPMYEAGMLQIGDPFVALQGEPVGQGLAEHVFECKPSCTQAFLANSSVTVFREILHMHESGSSMYSAHYRDGEVIRTARAEFFDFPQQGAQNVIQEPYELKAGDHFRTGCFYMNSDNERVFGMASSDEMCINFLMYYPRKNVNGAPFYCGIGMSGAGFPEVCDATHERVELAEAELDLEQERSFGQPSSICYSSHTPGDNSGATLSATHATFLWTTILGLLVIVA